MSYKDNIDVFIMKKKKNIFAYLFLKSIFLSFLMEWFLTFDLFV
jgi:hypothetical protein